jgi:hypothetical protein
MILLTEEDDEEVVRFNIINKIMAEIQYKSNLSTSSVPKKHG